MLCVDIDQLLQRNSGEFFQVREKVTISVEPFSLRKQNLLDRS